MRDLNYSLGRLVVSTDTSALRTKVDLDVIESLDSSSNGFHSLERHHLFAFRTGNIFFHYCPMKGCESPVALQRLTKWVNVLSSFDMVANKSPTRASR